MEDEDVMEIAHNYVNTSAVYFDNGRLSYIGQDCRRIPPVLGQLYGLKVHYLDLSYNSLSSLQGIEKFPNLEELVLDNNQLEDSLHLHRLPNLHTLSLNKNKIVDLELLLTKIANNLPKLTYLSLLGNIACPNQLSDVEKDDEDYQRYRYYVLYRLPKLKFLDSSVARATEKIEAQRRGSFMKVIKPPVSSPADTANSLGSSPVLYTPLPREGRLIGGHKGAYGKCRYRYSGKHSEGNRFIQNNDL